MTDEIFHIKRNDTGPKFKVALNDGKGGGVNITGATSVRFHMGAKGAAAAVDAAATVVQDNPAIVEYAWAAANTANAGDFYAEIEVTLADGSIETFPNDREGWLVRITEDKA